MWSMNSFWSKTLFQHKCTFKHVVSFKAHAANKENIKASLEKGKYADIAVWVDDPAALPLEQLAMTIQVSMTLGGGQIIYQDCEG